MVRILALLTALAAVAPAADTTLLYLAMPDAKVVAGVDVVALRNSPFGQFALSKLADKEGSSFKEFVESTGFDPRRDLTEILYASPGSGGAPKKQLFLARGTFDPLRLTAAANKAGAQTSSYNGVDILAFGSKNSADHIENALAFLDGGLVVAGDLESVRAAISRRQAGGGLTGDLAAKATTLGAANQIWFASTLSFSDIASHLPKGGAGGPAPAELFKSIQQASGGLKFEDTATVWVELVAQTAEDASSLSGAFQMLLGMAQMQQKPGTPPQLQQVLKALTLNTAGNSVRLGLTLPEATLESLIPPSGSNAPKRP